MIFYRIVISKTCFQKILSYYVVDFMPHIVKVCDLSLQKKDLSLFLIRVKSDPSFYILSICSIHSLNLVQTPSC